MTTVFVGGGHAAGQACVNLRHSGFLEPITIVSNEAIVPYKRPSLAKRYLRGDRPLSELLVRPQQFYAENNISCIFNMLVEDIDINSRYIKLSDGSKLNWDRIILATGSVNHQLTIPGCDAQGILYLRTVEESNMIKEYLQDAPRIVVVGGGYTGLEVAASCRQLGHQVTVLEVADQILSRVTQPQVADFIVGLHESNGTEIRTQTQVVEFETNTNNSVCGVRLSDDTSIETDLVIVAVGVEPVTDLGRLVGLPCENGFEIDQLCQTTLPDVYAIGDCTNFYSEFLGRRIRLECIPNALMQAQTLAATLTDSPTPYQKPPWFWSDQYDFKLQMTGFSTEGEQTVRRELSTDERDAFIVFNLKEDMIVGVDVINSPDQALATRRLVGSSVDSKLLEDPTVPLTTLL